MQDMSKALSPSDRLLFSLRVSFQGESQLRGGRKGSRDIAEKERRERAEGWASETSEP